MRTESQDETVLRKMVVLALAFWMTLIAMTSRADDALDLARYRGKLVVVDFWASWCAPCRQSLPWLNSIQSRYRDRGLIVIGVNVDRERAEADRFLCEVPAQFPIVYDSAGTLAAKYQLLGMPSSFVFGPDGELLSTHVGFKLAGRAEREAELERLLQRHVPAPMADSAERMTQVER